MSESTDGSPKSIGMGNDIERAAREKHRAMKRAASAERLNQYYIQISIGWPTRGGLGGWLYAAIVMAMPVGLMLAAIWLASRTRSER